MKKTVCESEHIKNCFERALKKIRPIGTSVIQTQAKINYDLSVAEEKG